MTSMTSLQARVFFFSLCPSQSAVKFVATCHIKFSYNHHYLLRFIFVVKGDDLFDIVLSFFVRRDLIVVFFNCAFAGIVSR